MNNNHPIIDHAVKEMANMFGIEPETIKTYKFTIRYPDGCKSEPIFKATSLKEARKGLNYWFPGHDIELGVKETES